MLNHPRLRSQYTVRVVEPSLLFLMAEHSEHVFQGEAYAVLAPLLDGHRTMGEVVSLASTRGVSLAGLFAALGHLESKQCLVEGEPLADPAAAAFWDAVPAPAERVAEALTAGVSVQAFGEDPAALQRALGDAGVSVRDAGALRVLLVDDYLRADLVEANRTFLESGQAWALAKVHGAVAWVGPVFRPRETACWECLAHRLRVNRQVEYYLHQKAKRPILDPPRAWLPASVGAAAAWASTELARALVAGPGGRIDGRILTLDMQQRTMQEHVVVRRPQCPACGEAPADTVRAVTPASQPRGRRAERTSDPQETYNRYKHLVSPLTGVVTHLAPRGGSHGAHNYVAGHYYPVTSHDLSGLRINLIARSGGKGRTEAQARTSALCEAIERYSGIFWNEEIRKRATRTEMGSDAVAIDQLAMFSDRQRGERDSKPAASDFQEVPPPLGDDVPISWTPAWSLTHQRARWVPTAYCYYGFRDPGVFFTRCDSNGNAAGNTLEEAILYGFLELVERDAVALWWYNRARRPGVAIDPGAVPYWDEMRRYYERELGREIHALDLTTDLGIPTVGVISRRKDRAVEDITVGFAAHFDPEVAFLRALEEANQYLPSVLEQAEDGSTIYRLYSPETLRWWKTATFANQPWLLPSEKEPPRRLADMPSLASDDVARDVETAVATAARAGLEVLVLDQTRPDIGLPVVKVMVPGLRHFWRRLAPGRLYDVPVALGWLDQPLTEDEMNPISCFV